MTEATEVKKTQYEIGYLVPTEEVGQEIASRMKSYDTEVTAEGAMKRIKLAYKIGKETQAFFGYIQFAAEPEKAKMLEQDLRANPNIIRTIIVKLPKPSKKGVGTGKPSPRPVAAKPAAEPQVAAISNEALEKKIEEILQ